MGSTVRSAKPGASSGFSFALIEVSKAFNTGLTAAAARAKVEAAAAMSNSWDDPENFKRATVQYRDENGGLSLR